MSFALCGHPDAERAQQIAYLAQGHDIHWPLPVEQVVNLGRLPHRYPWSKITAADQQAIDRALRQAVIEHLIGRTVDTLSGGERARVLLARALAPVETAIGGWKALVEARAAYGRLDALLAARPAVPATALPAPQGALSVDKLCYVARGVERPLLQGVTFALEPGKALGVIGASGSGKSTLGRLIAGCCLLAGSCVTKGRASSRPFLFDERCRTAFVVRQGGSFKMFVPLIIRADNESTSSSSAGRLVLLSSGEGGHLQVCR